MTLHNYWWLLIWAFLFGGISFAFIPKQEEYVLSRRVVRWDWLSAAALAVPYVIWAGWRTNTYGDTGVYRNTFLSMPTGLGGLWSYVSTRRTGYGFVFFEYLFKTLISRSDIAFFTVLAAVQMLLLVSVFRKYSRNYWLSLFFFVASTDYLSWMHNGIRQFLAVTIIFACLPLLIEKKYFLMCIAVFFATWIHTSAIIFLPFIFIINGRALNMRTSMYILALIVAIFFMDRVSDFIVKSMENTEYEGDIEIFLQDDGTNIMRVLFYSVPAFMSWFFRPYIDRANDPLINICANLSVVSAGLYVFSFFTSGILVGALPIYFSLANYILIPWFITEVFDSVSAFLIELGFVGVYSFFFYYQVGVTWRLM